MSIKKTPKYVDIEGQRFSLCFHPKLVKSVIDYEPTSSDIFVVTYPKCGTTWMIQIVLLILRKGELPEKSQEYFALSPYLEMLGADVIKEMPGPGCLKTHLPFDVNPYSPDAKYIYVARNPRDCLVSFYHHTKFFPGYYFTDGTFEDFFEIFIKGQTDSGDYFDNLLSWYEHRHDKNVFFTTYEQMRVDTKGTILKVAEFLGEAYSSVLVADQELLDLITEKSSLRYMKDTTNTMWRDIVDNPKMLLGDPNLTFGIREWARVNYEAQEAGEKSIGQFIRGGSVGGAKTVLSPDQERRLRERIREKTSHSDVMDLWKDMFNEPLT